MNRRDYKYAMLMSSLPVHRRDLFSTAQTPISEIQLNKRLQWLDKEDARDLAKIQSTLYWSAMAHDSDQEYIQHAQQVLASVNNDFFRQVMQWRLDLRTLVAALRHRNKGLKSPPSVHQLGRGRWSLLIARHWEQDDFGIGHQLPWLGKANSLMQSGQVLELEKLLLNRVWQHYEQQGRGHYFDFEAVIIYVLRWDVINRWSNYDSTQALERLNDIVAQCLKDFRSLNQTTDSVSL